MNENYKKKIRLQKAERLKEIRINSKMTATAFAKMLGVKQPAYAKYERGFLDIPDALYSALGSFKYDVDYIIHGKAPDYVPGQEKTLKVDGMREYILKLEEKINLLELNLKTTVVALNQCQGELQKCKIKNSVKENLCQSHSKKKDFLLTRG